MTLQLKEARIQAGYSIEEVAKVLNIRKQYLHALEEEDYHILPGQVYTEGYKKLYAKYLGISLTIDSNIEEEHNFFNIKLASQKKFKKYIVAVSIMMLVLIVTIYQLILQSDSNASKTLKIESSNYKTYVNYPNERDQ